MLNLRIVSAPISSLGKCIFLVVSANEFWEPFATPPMGGYGWRPTGCQGSVKTSQVGSIQNRPL